MPESNVGNRMKHTLIVVAGLVLATPSSSAQPSASPVVFRGTVNGKPFEVKQVQREPLVIHFIARHNHAPGGPADEQELTADRARWECEQIRSRLLDATREEQKRRFAISVTEEEMLRGCNEELKRVDLAALAEQARREARMRLDALNEVYEKGADPKQVYEKSLAGRKVNQTGWAIDLYIYPTAEARTRLASVTLTKTPAPSTLDGIVRTRMENERLDTAVDPEIGANDPTFAAYSEEQARLVPKGNGSMRAAHYDYLQPKRLAWWKARYSELSLTLSDPAIADRCGIAREFGIRVPGSQSAR